jgi:hypothetical protein
MLRLMLKDKPRLGAPLTYTPEQQCAIIGLAVRSPEEFGLPINYWTHRELAIIANREGLAEGISVSTVGRILAKADLKPHMSKYWEKPNIDDEEEFQKQVAFICETYRKVLKRGSFSSTDELRQKMLDFIEYFNKTMAKAFKWTYKGRLLQA